MNEPPRRSWRTLARWGAEAARQSGRLLWFAWRRAGEQSIGVRASALAFTSVVSLVPLLAAFTFVGAQAFAEYQSQFQRFLVEILPYSEAAILDALGRFVAQAERVRGPGIVGFAAVALGILFTVEETINRTWEASASRPLRTRLVSYLLLFLFGPLLIGGGLSLWFVLEREAGVTGVPLRGLLPPVATFTGLTLLYWLVPYARVRVASAALGAVTATAALELLRRGFGAYLGIFGRTNQLVYGSYAAALFLMLSLQVGWWLVLGGNVLAYCHQFRRAMLRGPEVERRTLASDPWLAFAALALLAEQAERRPAEIGLGPLAEELAVSPARLQRALAPLEQAGWVARSRSYSPRLSTSPEVLSRPLVELFALFEAGVSEELPATGPLAGIAALRSRFLREWAASTREATLGEAIRGLPAAAAEEPLAAGSEARIDSAPPAVGQ